jgi:hypothetical protein
MSKAGVLSKLPSDLHYLIKPALKYGIHQTEDDRAQFLQRATDEELTELAQVAERYRVNEHCDLVSDFFDDYPITDYKESAKLYWLFGVMDAAGLKISPKNWNTVERHIKSLGKFGTLRLASERAHAALSLSEFGKEARPAIPHLRRALQDEDLRVRVWAHYALTIIEGNRAEHEQGVREIFSRHDRKDELDCYDDVGGAASAVLKKFAELSKEGMHRKKGER